MEKFQVGDLIVRKEDCYCDWWWGLCLKLNVPLNTPVTIKKINGGLIQIIENKEYRSFPDAWDTHTIKFEKYYGTVDLEEFM